jgi:hypothetical protein
MMGSCFAEHIGEQLQHHKFDTLVNPNGILFNPISIFNAVKNYADKQLLKELELFEYNDLWYSWEHHGLFADIKKETALQKINDSQQQAISYFNQADYLIFTLGSACVYELKETNKIVANCHKVQQKKFNKKLLSVDEIVKSYETISTVLSDKKIVFTVSPVRYIRDGIVENNISKAVLIQAIYELMKKYPNCYYFPAYEIVIDELRDYRFFEKDLVHPNKLAIEYVWERFSETIFDDETKNILIELKQILSAKQHKPFHKNSIQHQQFLETYLDKTNALVKAYSFIKMEEELAYFLSEN